MNRNRKLGKDSPYEFQELKRKTRKNFFVLLKALVKDYDLTIKDIEALLAVFAKFYVEQERQRIATMVQKITKEVEKWPDWMLCDRTTAPAVERKHKKSKS